MIRNKTGLKEKIVQLYEALFKCSDLPSLVDNESYWSQFFLLKANPKALDEIVTKLVDDEFIKHKNLFNLIFTQSILTLNCDNYIRITNSLVTILSLSKCILNRTRVQPNVQGNELIDFLFGYKDIDVKLEILSTKLCNLLLCEVPLSMKSIILKIYSTLITSTDDINKSPFIQHLISDDLLDALINLLANSPSRQQHGFQVIVIITILVNYRGNKVGNFC